MFRQLKPYQLAVDVSIASVCFLLRIAIGADYLLLIVVLLMALALALRRVSPPLALGILWVGVIFQLVMQLQPDISNAAVIPVLFVTSRYGSPTLRWLGLASAIAGAFLAVGYVYLLSFSGNVYIYRSPNTSTVIFAFSIGLASALALFTISWTIGLLVRTWALARESREAQSRAEREQALAEREVGIEQERTRIARDMHDVVAHSLAVVIAQADGARYARAQDPDAADAALTTISTTAREALADVRLLLGQLRHSQSEGPQPVLADLDRLLDQMRAAGLTIARHETGSPHALATGQQLAVYRIVQESLTNALRHGSSDTPVTIDFEWQPENLVLTITNGLATSGPKEPGKGHGLDGMRERAILAGGTLTAAPDGDRFVVTASLVTA